MKKLAIHLYGHMRTFDKAYETFFKHIVEPNKEDYEIDIFIHTWDTLCVTPQKGCWHENRNYFNDLIDKPTNLEQVKEIYKPTSIKMEKLNEGEYGIRRSMESVQNLRKEYEKLHGKYDMYLTTRPDIYFDSPLKINYFLELYNKDGVFATKCNLSLPETFIFTAGLPFNHSVLDPRFPNDGDLLWFSNSGEYIILYGIIGPSPTPPAILMSYRNCCEFIILRENMDENHFKIFKKKPKGMGVALTWEVDRLLYEKEDLLNKIDSVWFLIKKIRKAINKKLKKAFKN